MESVLDLSSVPVPEYLRCPICFVVPVGKVLQCKDGHVICESCYGQVVQCPQCRVDFGPLQIRNRHIEKMLDELKFPCPFTTQGCGVKLGRGQIQSHASSCRFDLSKRSSFSDSIGICVLLGHPNCGFRMRRNFTSEVVLHLQLVHGRSLVSSNWPTFRTIEEQVNWVRSAVHSSNGNVAPSAPPIVQPSPANPPPLSRPQPQPSSSGLGPSYGERTEEEYVFCMCLPYGPRGKKVLAVLSYSVWLLGTGIALYIIIATVVYVIKNS